MAMRRRDRPCVGGHARMVVLHTTIYSDHPKNAVTAQEFTEALPSFAAWRHLRCQSPSSDLRLAT
jgi:hypothetical protein